MIDPRSATVCEATMFLAVLASSAGMTLGGCQQQRRYSAGDNPALRAPLPEFEMRQDRPPRRRPCSPWRTSLRCKARTGNASSF